MPTSAGGRALRAAALPAGLALVVVASFVVVYPIRGFRVAIGSDTPVYVWWARLAGANGMGPLGSGARPVIVGLLASLARVTGAPIAGIAGALPPVLAGSLALAAGAFAEAALGPDHADARRFALVALLTGGFLSTMAGGYASTLAFGTLFVAGLACLAIGLQRPGRGPALAAAALIGAAGLAHPLFLILGAAVIGGGLALLLPAWRRDRRLAMPSGQTSAGRLLIASVAGAALAGIGLVASNLGAGPVAVDTSRDAVLRRVGLGHLLHASYVRKLRHDFPWWRAYGLTLPAFLPFVGPARRTRSRSRVATESPDRRLLFWGAVGAWLLVAIVGVVTLLAGLTTPGQRLAAFCLPLPILAGVGLSFPAGSWLRAGGVATRVLVGLATLAAVIVFVVVAWLPWSTSVPLASDVQVTQARAAGAALGRTAPHTPLILVIDDRGERPALVITRFANYLRDAVPIDRIAEVHTFVGTAADLLRGRPTLTGQAEHDRMANLYWREVRPLLARHPLAVVVRSFRAAGAPAPATVPGETAIASGVSAVPGMTGTPASVTAALPPDQTRPGAGPLSPWLPVLLAPALLAILAALGWPWTRIAMPDAHPRAWAALAPSFGAAALGLACVAADAAGLRLSGAGGFIALGAAAFGWVVWPVTGSERVSPARTIP